MGSFQGMLKDYSAPQLGAIAISRALEQSSRSSDEVDEVIIGNVISAGLKQAPARQAMREAGLPDACGATTVNKVCGSGMKAAMLATDLIRAGSAQTVVAGGMESMTNAPYLLGKARGGLRMGHSDLKDSMFLDGLEDAETGGAMGAFAQQTADDYQLSREAMDSFAIESLRRANAAIETRALHSEIAPVTVGDQQLLDDEAPGRARPEKIPNLRPAFKSDGTITAANSSSISDGASAMVLSAQPGTAEQPALAKVIGHATHSQHPSEFTIAPIGAIRKLCDRVGWDLDDVELFEINEAFAMVTMLAISELQLDPARVNIYGGACAQGHPIGSTGARLITTLAHALQRENKTRGIAALCIGGGEATAVALERVAS
jgi:acetyl-CoA C-acetyltransferase